MYYHTHTRRGLEEVGSHRIYSSRRRPSHVQYLRFFRGKDVPNSVRSLYLVRLGLTTYYEHRISSIQGHLDELQKRRDSAIEKLKAATKYNDTQDLLKKYGGASTSRVKPAGISERKTSPQQSGAPKGGRTTAVPPPTANIPGRNGPATLPNTPQYSIAQTRGPLGQGASYSALGATPPTRGPVSPQGISAEFAPNAFSAIPQYSEASGESRWYDRIMDVLLGEDETLPRARLALICSNCRLVNGQAPPGVKRLEDVGKWRCGGCGATKYEALISKKIPPNCSRSIWATRNVLGHIHCLGFLKSSRLMAFPPNFP